MHKDGGNPLLLVNRAAGHSSSPPKSRPCTSFFWIQASELGSLARAVCCLWWICPDHENQDSQFSEIGMKTIKEEELISLNSKQMGQLTKELGVRISRGKLGHAWQLKALNRILSAAKEVRHLALLTCLSHQFLDLFTCGALSSVAISVSALGGTAVASPITMPFAGISFPKGCFHSTSFLLNPFPTAVPNELCLFLCARLRCHALTLGLLAVPRGFCDSNRH
jgi:hypothetical protein